MKMNPLAAARHGLMTISMLFSGAVGAHAAALQLEFSPPSSFNEFNQQVVLQWNAESGKTYVIQSAGDLASPDPWKDTDLVTSSATGPIRWMAPEAVTEQKYYRLVLPQPTATSVTPAFINSGDPAALFYIQGQCLPTDGSVVINDLNFSVVSSDPSGTWLAVSLNGLPPGTPVIGNILVLDNGSNVVTTLPLQNPVHYGTEMTIEQLQGPPTDPPASPVIIAWLSKKGYDYYQAQSDLNTTGLQNNPAFSENANLGQMVDARPAHFLTKKGYDYYQAQSALRGSIGGGLDEDEDGDGFEPSATLLMPALMKVKEKANRTKCKNTLRVSPATGEVQGEEIDLYIPGRGLDFVWMRTYRSRTGPSSAQGARWDYSYNVSLTPQPDGTVLLRSGNGRADTFYPNGTNGWFRDEFFLHIGDVDRDGAPDLVTFPDTGRWVFHPQVGSPAPGKLAQIIDRNGNTIALHYDAVGRLEHIVDDLGRTNTIAYNLVDLIASVTDFSGRTVQYEYDGNGDLTAVISPPVIGTPNGNDFPGGKTNRFTYTSGYPNPAQNHLMLTSVDGKGQVTHQHVYQHNQSDLDFLRCISVQRDTNPPVDLTYLPATPTDKNGFTATKTIVRDAVGNVCEIFSDSRQRCVRLLEYTGRAPNLTVPTTETVNRPEGKLRTDDPDFFETRFAWNEDSLCTRVVYPRGNSEEMVYQRAFNQNASRSNKSGRHHAGDLRVHRAVACCDTDDDGDGLVDTLVSTFEYDPRFGSPPVFATSGEIKIKHKGWDGLIYHRVRPKGWDGTVKGSTASARVIVDRDSGLSKGFGFVISSTDPRGIVTTAAYDNLGNLKVLSAKDWKRQLVITELTDHNIHGQLTAITNAADGSGYRRVDRFTYHSSGAQAGYLQSIAIDEPGVNLTTSYEYDARGNITRCVDANTNDWLFTYNQLDQCVVRQTPKTDFGSLVRYATTYSYDEAENLVFVDVDNRDGDGNLGANPVWRTQFVYDSLNRLTGCWRDKNGALWLRCTAVEYNGNDNIVRFLSGEALNGGDTNAVVQFLYDERDLLFQSTVAPGTGLSATNLWSYDENGLPSEKHMVESITFVVERVERDGFGRPIQVTDATSNTVTYVYDRNGNVTSVRSYGELNDSPGAGGNVLLDESTMVYDGLDRMTFFFSEPVGFSAGRGMMAYTYAPNGQCTSVTDANLHVSRALADPLGRTISVTDPKTNITTYTYDGCGNVLSVTQTDRSDLGGAPQQFRIVAGYDKLHRLTRTVDSAGNTNLYAYDSRNNLVRHTDPKGNDTVYEYDGLNRCIATRCYDGAAATGITISTSHVEYDDNDRVVATTDANTNTTTYAYDSLDRCVQVTEADGTRANLVWSPRSNLVLEQDANGTVISNSFDLLDRCVRRDIFPGPGVAATTTFEEFSYDGLSRLVLASNDVSLSTFLYDSRDNCISQTQDGLTTAATYDTVGNCLSRTYPSGRIVTYTYDGLDQVSSISSGISGLPPTQLATYSYDGAGRLGRIARANNVNTRFQWNGLVNPPNGSGDFGFGQVAGINHQVAGGGATIDRRIATYDRNQNRTSRTQTVPFFTGGDTLTNLFDYDALDRLRLAIKTKGTSAQRKDYTLDGNGNRQSVAVDLVPEPYIMDNTFPDPADFQMNQYTLTPHGLFEYDANGNRVSRGTATGQLFYQYDYADRLVAVTDLASGLPELVCTYSYDALGRQIGKVRLSTAQQIAHVYMGRQVIEERENGTLKRTYAFPHVFDQKGRIMFTDTGDTLYCHDDDLGNALALTDATGAVVERYEYNDFGAVSFLTSDGLPNATGTSAWDYLYCWGGQRVELDTGLHHAGGGDYYDPQVGRAIRGKVKDIKSSTMGKSITGKTNPWSPGGSKAQDHNSSRSNGCGGRTKAQDHNSSRSNKTASGIDLGGGGSGGGISGLIVPVAMDKGLRFRSEGGRHTPFHNRMVGGALPGGQIISAAVSSVSALAGSGSGAASASYAATGRAAPIGGSTQGGGLKAQDHNSSRSNKTASLADWGGGGGGGGSDYWKSCCEYHRRQKTGHVTLMK